jgi:hypothetical protein
MAAMTSTVACLSDVLDFVGLEVMKTAKGRDKIAAFFQNAAKFQSLQNEIGSSDHAILRAVENNISNGRKIFKWMKFIPEFTKSRAAFRRASKQEGMVAVRSMCESVGRMVSCVYFFFDNVIWGCSMGLLQSSHLPGHLINVMLAPEDGALVRLLGGSSQLATRKNYLSMYRIYCQLFGEAMFAFQCLRSGVAGRTHELISHFWELVTLGCNLRMTWQRIYGPIPMMGGKLGHQTMGQLGMMASLAVLFKMWTERKPAKK